MAGTARKYAIFNVADLRSPEMMKMGVALGIEFIDKGSAEDKEDRRSLWWHTPLFNVVRPAIGVSGIDALSS